VLRISRRKIDSETPRRDGGWIRLSSERIPFWLWRCYLAKKKQNSLEQPRSRLLVDILGNDSDAKNIIAAMNLSSPKKNKKNEPNAIRKKLASILRDCLGVDCEWDDLNPAKGSWRTNWKLDVYRWEVTCTKDGQPFVAGCWWTMTECVKAGAVRFDKKDMEIYPIQKIS
jgi:hypothetical protein